MNAPLGRKQRTRQVDWIRAQEHIRANPDYVRVDRLIAEAAGRVKARIRNVDGAVAYGWSGGKDSLALQQVMNAAGVKSSVLVISGLEYPAFLQWVTDSMPWGLTVECRDNLNYKWLREHPKMLFPKDAQVASRWFALIQHAGQRAYAKRVRLEVLILGRRRADANYMGDHNVYGHEYMDRGGFVRYSPIGDWSHEDVLHVIAARNVSMPPCYNWPRGYRVGTGAWPARQGTRSLEHGWKEVFSIDRSVVVTAAEHGILGAAEALRTAKI